MCFYLFEIFSLLEIMFLKFKIVFPFNYKVTYNYPYLSNRYQVLAFATDADKRQETEQQKLGSGKRLVVRPFF